MVLVFFIFSPRGSNRNPNYRLPSESAAFFFIVVQCIILVLVLVFFSSEKLCPKKLICEAFILAEGGVLCLPSQVVV